MKLLSRYLIGRLSVMSFYALLSLLALYSFFDFVNEVGDIGQGNYTGGTALLYVFMQIPAHAYQLMPLAVLLGALLALSQLANNSELAVIKTSGVSTFSLIGILLKFGLIFALITIALGEWAAPDISRRADLLKSSAKHGKISATANGVWVKQKNSMIYIAEMLPNHTLQGVKIWRYDESFHLIEAISAKRAQVLENAWTLYEVQSSRLEKEQVAIAKHDSQQWQSNINPNMLEVLLVKPEQMTLPALSSYITHLKNNQQQTRSFVLAWWNKLTYPVATIIMALLALAFTPQGGRHQNMGLRLLGGIGLGLLFHFAGRFFSFTSHIYHIPPFIAATLPTFAFALWAFWLIRYQEKR